MKEPFDKMIGQKVSALVQTPWLLSRHGEWTIRACTAGIVLENGTAFQLRAAFLPIKLDSHDSSWLNKMIAAELLSGSSIVGHNIVDILWSTLWVTAGVLVDDGRVACVDIVGDVVGLVVDPYGGDATSLVFGQEGDKCIVDAI